MKKETIRVEGNKLDAFTGRVVDDRSRPCIFRDRKKYMEQNRQKWKLDLKKGRYE